jgi:hypothetical protein
MMLSKEKKLSVETGKPADRALNSTLLLLRDLCSCVSCAEFIKEALSSKNTFEFRNEDMAKLSSLGPKKRVRKPKSGAEGGKASGKKPKPPSEAGDALRCSIIIVVVVILLHHHHLTTTLYSCSKEAAKKANEG